MCLKPVGGQSIWHDCRHGNNCKSTIAVAGLFCVKFSQFCIAGRIGDGHNILIRSKGGIWWNHVESYLNCFLPTTPPAATGLSITAAFFACSSETFFVDPLRTLKVLLDHQFSTL